MNKYELISDLKEHLDTYSQTFEDYNMTYNQVEMIYYYIKQLQQENQQLKLINKEYERLNKENGRGFAITSVKQYNIDELLKYKNNWNKLKQYIMKNDCHNDRHKVLFTYSELIVRMNELERGVSDVKD